MRKAGFYFITIVSILTFIGIVLVNHKSADDNNTPSFYALKQRKGTMAGSEEFREVQRHFDDRMKIARTNPDDLPSRIALAALFIQEGRITGEHSYYDEAALAYIGEVLKKDPGHFEALTLKALLYLSQHRFEEGLALAEKARSVNGDNAFVFGLLVDGYVEMGNYAAAIANAEKMISIRPDIRSYSRISYLREIHGDYAGAIEAMKLAVEAGLPGDETTEWCRVQLAQLYETNGEMKMAAIQYATSLAKRPFYAYAIAGQARLAKAAKDYGKAKQYYLQSISMVSDPSFLEGLADVYDQTGQKNKADSLVREIIHQVGREEEHDSHHAGHSHFNNDRELAHLYMRLQEYDKALKYALADHERRPSNIDANQTLAWVYYKLGDHNRALPLIQAAMKTNNKNPVLLCRAGLIFAKSGERSKAKELLSGSMGSAIPLEKSLRHESATVLHTL